MYRIFEMDLLPDIGVMPKLVIAVFGNGRTIEVLEWIRDFIAHFTGHPSMGK